MKQWTRTIAGFLGLLMVVSLLLPYGSTRAADLPSYPYGQVLDHRQMELAPGAVYNWYDMKLVRGLEKVHTVEFDPSNPMLELQAGTKSGKVYGMQGVTQMAAYADQPGNRVIAGINGDFYDLSNHGTGVPNGLFMGEGKILNTPDINNAVFVMNEDGTTKIGPTPKLTRTVTIGGVTSTITHINRYRADNQLVLYTNDYADSTKTTSLGDEVILDIVEGDVRSGQTMRLKVAEFRKDQGNSPLSPGKIVLSAHGAARSIIEGLQAGDEVTAAFELASGWGGAKVAMSGIMMIRDGVLLDNVQPSGVHPRTAIGTKADGKIVMMEVDGRAPSFSEGVETSELGQMMQNLGVTNAINLDGGGSSTFVARLPGESTFKMLNRGSDGGERATGNSLLLVNKAPEGSAAKLVVKPNLERVLAGSKIQLSVAAVDAAGHPAAFEGTPAWQVNPAIGSIDTNGVFTAGSTAGSAEIQVNAGGLAGTGEVEVVAELTELKFPDTENAVESGSTVTVSVKALRNGQEIKADNGSFEWRVEGDIGTLSAAGVFSATTASGKSGKIYAKYGAVETSMTVNVGTPPYMLENFENGISRYLRTAGANYNKAIASVTTEDEYVRFGSAALKLEYDFIGKIGTTGAYLQTINRTNYLRIPGYPTKISLWVYGDNSGNWLRAQMRDKDGAGGATPINFTSETVGVNWKGWKYVEADVPTGLTPPLTLDLPVRLMTTSKNPPVKGAGAIYVDDIRAVYGPVNDDFEPPIIRNMTPAEGRTVNTNKPVIRAIGEDAGYDPQQHPGTTLIDPNKISFYVDDVLVPHTLYPPEGKISYTPEIPLADGIHKAMVKIRDLSGNRAEKEWTFNVDTGSSKFVFDTPAEVYAGNTHSLDIKGFRLEGISGGEISYAFDLAKVDSLQVVPGDKLSASQVQSNIDAAAGTVLVKLAGLQGVSFKDSDVLAHIRYRVKPTAEGSNVIAFRSGKISLASAPGASAVFFGLPIQSLIKYPLTLGWNTTGVVEGYPTEFSVTNESGEPVAGATVMADGVVVGITDEAGKLVTSTLTQSVKMYKLQAFKEPFYSSVMTFAVSKRTGSLTPYNVSATIGANPTTSHGFTWHTHPDAQGTEVEVSELVGFTDWSGTNVRKLTGTSELFVTYDIGTVRVHKALVENLNPGTEYVYRLGDGAGNYSSQGSFKTASTLEDTVKFLFFGDSQASDKAGYALWGATVDKAFEFMSDPDFIVHAGDLVDNGYKENEWNMWFEAAQRELMNTTLVATLGNHEVTGINGKSDFTNHFNQPGNGLESLKGTNFSFDYGDVHFVMLNSEEQYAEQKEWLRGDLAATDKKWKVVMFHRGPYGSIYDTEIVRREWTPVFDEFGVDLVLNGHDHIYLRTSMKNDASAALGEGTAYVTPGSTGPKFYGLTRRDWTQVIDEEMTQMYAAIEIVGDQLTFVTRTVGGREVDRFLLVKDSVPPVTTAVYGTTNASGWFKEDVTVQLVSTDNRGVKEIVYHLEGAMTQEGTVVSGSAAAIPINQEGVTTIRYAAVDHSGNKEQEQELIIRLDKMAPIVEVTGAGTYSVDQTVTVACTASDSVSGVVYNPCTEPLVSMEAYKLGAGVHTLTVHAQDAAGNMAYVQVSYEVIVTLDGLSRLTKQLVEEPGAHGIVNALQEKLSKGNINAYINQVEALGREGKIKEAQVLIDFASML
ncbi:phosphodiester glycosidase family protein [Paenibacillus sp. V4I5]|uniref:phosphodiester glycosidase family protein n=1 Tax=Paenibacillus sp. V4I5 TaxID=3042306 RepID=UPI0027929527|nr:phosphodiester glycosidase family protein [Paenibacillus sp. V4I5]MDQ0914904.1 exopolysaccharide biosynthesis protein/predicted phosphodiesterase [Paenibacillus sp. V4I5]